ncbi:Chaperone protein DnaK [subsurface metagenome]
MQKIFGIDLGTTNSEIAYLKNGKPEIVAVADGKNYLPSVVGLDPSGNIITGFAARNQYAAFPENTVISIKRKMGSEERVSMGAKEYSPAKISSYILKTLKEAAERETGAPVEKAVITVPAYFTDLQRKDTIQAGELAGLDVVRVINEPTAAALAYGCREDQREKILVYDFGGGTFDISLIDVEEGIVEVLATDGNTHLGGDDIDQVLEELLISHLPAGSVSQEDLRVRARLKNIAESAKINLSSSTLLDVKEEFITTVKGKPVNLELTVTRQDLEKRIDGLLGRTFTLLNDVIKQGKLKNEDISKLLLVGGSTYIPCILNTLSDKLGFDVHREVDPIYCVAIGAAIQGAIISGEEIDTILVDVNSHSLGIKCLDITPTGYLNRDRYSIIIHRNTPIPASMAETYYTMVANQKAVHIDAYQGENPAASKNTFIGSFIMHGLPQKLPAGSEIDVNFEYNLNGIVEVSAFERRSGRKEKMRVDVNRIGSLPAEVQTASQSDARAVKEPESAKLNTEKIERILKTASKKLNQIENQKLLEEIKAKIKSLEKAVGEENLRAERLSEELVDLIADI